MTPEQRAAWFTYHAPTDETAPKYAAIRAAEEECLRNLFESPYEHLPQARYDEINTACADFAAVIDAEAPDGYDKDAAIRCVRLARNAANEAVVNPKDAGRLMAMAKTEIQKARWQAGNAIGCRGV